MARNSVKTIYHTQLELLRSKNLTFEVADNSTLNEKFTLANTQPPGTGYPSINYLAIGRGGHRVATGVADASIVDILEHGPTDAALFEHIPFVMRATTDDLTGAERSKYRIRTLERHNNINYFAYYLRVLNSTSSVLETNIISLTNGVITSDETYVPGPTNLTPSPVEISNTMANTVSGRHIVVKTEEVITLSESDITEIRNAVFIKHGDYRYATISEIGIVSGFDKEITSSLGSVAATYNEIQSGQIVNFIGTEYSLHDARTEIRLTYSLSNTLPYPAISV